MKTVEPALLPIPSPIRLTAKGWAALLLVVLLVLAQLMSPPLLGVANNGDFERMMKWGGLEYVTPDYDEKYFNWINREFRFVKSPWHVWRGFGSTEAVFVKFSAIIGWLWLGDRFDLRILGCIHLLAFLAAFRLLMKGWRASTSFSPLLLLPAFLLIFCDLGYTVYFNSFYSEASSLIFLLATAGAGLHLASQNPRRRSSLLLFCLCAGLFIAAKPQNFTFIPVVLLFCIRLAMIERGKFWRATIAAFAFTLIAAAALLSVMAPWYTNNGKYQSTFYGILKDSPAPAQDLKDLGLDEKFAVLANTTTFHQNLPVDIRSREFHEEFYQRIHHLKIARFYLTHPQRLLEKLRLTARHGFTLRAGYGNFEKASGAPPRAQADRWSFWSSLKQSYWPKQLWFFVAYCAMLLALIVKGYREDKTGRLTREFYLALWLMMLIAFVTPIIGDGESDFIKHLFLFNAMFDLSLVFLSGLLLRRVAGFAQTIRNARHAKIGAPNRYRER